MIITIRFNYSINNEILCNKTQQTENLKVVTQTDQ